MPIIVQSTRASGQLGGTEKALKHEYDDITEKWEVTTIFVRLDPTVIAEGTNRLVYNITDLSAPKGKQSKVAKAAKSSAETRQETFKAVVMQKRCQRLAEKFNSLGAPKKVNFIDTCIVEFVQRPADHTGGHPIMIMEPRLEGTYKKYSNNFGYVDKEDRNTPQAFSHFTFQYTNSKMIVVDIQGVKDVYTDPQIHSNIPESAPPIWGQGDMGDTGIYKFFESHRCNALCKFFGLNPSPFAQPKASHSGTRIGAAALTNVPAPLISPSHSGVHLSTNMGYPLLSLPSAAYPKVTYSSGTSSQLNDFLDSRAASTLFTSFSSYTSPMNYSWATDLIVV
eukprot:EG_transcript_10341